MPTVCVHVSSWESCRGENKEMVRSKARRCSLLLALRCVLPPSGSSQAEGRHPSLCCVARGFLGSRCRTGTPQSHTAQSVGLVCRNLGSEPRPGASLPSDVSWLGGGCAPPRASAMAGSTKAWATCSSPTERVRVCPQPLGGGWCLSHLPQEEGRWQLGWGASPRGHCQQLEGPKKIRMSPGRSAPLLFRHKQFTER